MKVKGCALRFSVCYFFFIFFFGSVKYGSVIGLDNELVAMDLNCARARKKKSNTKPISYYYSFFSILFCINFQAFDIEEDVGTDDVHNGLCGIRVDRLMIMLVALFDIWCRLFDI